MDVPRELVYEERTSLDEFDYKDPKSINGQLFLKGLAKIAEIKTGEPGFESRLLRVYNDAYYICTLVIKFENSVLTLYYYKQNLDMPSVVLPLVYIYLDNLSWKREHIEPFLTVLETDIKANGWEENLKTLKDALEGKNNIDPSIFEYRRLTPELIENIHWWKVTDNFKFSEITRVLLNFAHNEADFELIIDGIKEEAGEYEWNYNQYETRIYNDIDEDGNHYTYEEKPIDLSDVYIFCDNLKGQYPKMDNYRNNKNSPEENPTPTIINLQQFLKKDWFDELSSNRRIYTKEWRDKLVVDLIASEYGADIVKQWHTKKGNRTKTLIIKMQLAGTIWRAGVFGKKRQEEIANKIKSSFQQMKETDKTLTRYMQERPPYHDWLISQITNNQVENPIESSD